MFRGAVFFRSRCILTAYRKSYNEKSIGTKMNDLDLCWEVVSMSCLPLRYIRHWISRKPLEIEAWFEMAHGLSYGHVTSRDPERSNSWSHYAYSAISRKRLEIETPFQGNTNRKWHIGYQLVTWQMTSRDSPKVLWGSTVGYPGDSLASCYVVVCY